MAQYNGSDVADGTLTTACDMAPTTGGTETSKTTTLTGSNNVGEITSQGLSVATTAAIPSTPTGKGWVFQPGAGTYATGNWSFIITLSFASVTLQTTLTVRFFKYTGSYTSIGTLTLSPTFSTSKTTYTFSASSLSSMTFGSSDLLYVDCWVTGSGGVGSHNPTVYESTSASTGVANDVQVTTSTFTAGAATPPSGTLSLLGVG